MRQDYKLCYKLVAGTLLLSLCLQSCSSQLYSGSTRESYVSTAPNGLLIENGLKKVDQTSSKKLLEPVGRRWLGEVTTNHLLTTLPLLCSVKRSKSFAGTRSIIGPSCLSVHSKNPVLLSCRTPFVSTCRMSEDLLSTTKLSSARLKCDKLKEKETETTKYCKHSFKGTRKTETKNHNS